MSALYACRIGEVLFLRPTLDPSEQPVQVTAAPIVEHLEAVVLLLCTIEQLDVEEHLVEYTPDRRPSPTLRTQTLFLLARRIRSRRARRTAGCCPTREAGLPKRSRVGHLGSPGGRVRTHGASRPGHIGGVRFHVRHRGIFRKVPRHEHAEAAEDGQRCPRRLDEGLAWRTAEDEGALAGRRRARCGWTFPRLITSQGRQPSGDLESLPWRCAARCLHSPLRILLVSPSCASPCTARMFLRQAARGSKSSWQPSIVCLSWWLCCMPLAMARWRWDTCTSRCNLCRYTSRVQFCCVSFCACSQLLTMTGLSSPCPVKDNLPIYPRLGPMVNYPILAACLLLLISSARGELASRVNVRGQYYARQPSNQLTNSARRDSGIRVDKIYSACLFEMCAFFFHPPLFPTSAASTATRASNPPPPQARLRRLLGRWLKAPSQNNGPLQLCREAASEEDLHTCIYSFSSYLCVRCCAAQPILLLASA